MEIKACTIMGFGKFHRRSFSFSDGIHVIYGENEAGKTTLRTFLVSMLFGIDRKRGAASKKDEFHKYQPYMGGIYGGSLDFSFQGEDYQIQRDFVSGHAQRQNEVCLSRSSETQTGYAEDRDGDII